ncbi:unnamed protein product [Arctogadus glacialis]
MRRGNVTHAVRETRCLPRADAAAAAAATAATAAVPRRIWVTAIWVRVINAGPGLAPPLRAAGRAQRRSSCLGLAPPSHRPVSSSTHRGAINTLEDKDPERLKPPGPGPRASEAPRTQTI